MPLLPAGGGDFAHDPDAQPDGAPPFWSPHFNPQAIILSPVKQMIWPDGARSSTSGSSSTGAFTVIPLLSEAFLRFAPAIKLSDSW